MVSLPAILCTVYSNAPSPNESFSGITNVPDISRTDKMIPNFTREYD